MCIAKSKGSSQGIIQLSSDKLLISIIEIFIRLNCIISLWYRGNRGIFPIFTLLNRFSLRIIRLKERHTLLDDSMKASER